MELQREAKSILASFLTFQFLCNNRSSHANFFASFNNFSSSDIFFLLDLSQFHSGDFSEYFSSFSFKVTLAGERGWEEKWQNQGIDQRGGEYDKFFIYLFNVAKSKIKRERSILRCTFLNLERIFDARCGELNARVKGRGLEGDGCMGGGDGRLKEEGKAKEILGKLLKWKESKRFWNKFIKLYFLYFYGFLF